MEIAGVSSVDPEQELKKLTAEIDSLDHEIAELQRKRRLLQQKKDKLTDAVNNQKTAKLASLDWGTTDYPWSAELEEKMKTVFGIENLRPHQLPTMNATMSSQDVILLMPTGGGKSLCFQLPAVISKGFTLVVSPLVALMEDQIMALKKKNIGAEMLNASTTKTRVTEIQNEMTNKNSKMKLLYVTPEKLAKSKRFMAKLQKAFQMNRLDRIAIDEVHCCSQWGHDFRKDYKFLGVLKSLFPNVPLIGLTATAPSRVLADVQKILNIEGCLVFRASFNRPNLYYEVRPKPSSHKECVDELEKLLKHKYKGQSGIIYTTSIKDTEELMNDLRSRGLKVGCYHANLEPEMRSKCHQKWTSNYYQAVVATIAFGMGMDKPDVRFVIHHSLSKSMANFYQESGRAGRDDQPADCILYYRFADLFRVSTMVFAEETGLENIYGMVAYCLDAGRCRRQIIAEHFEESWESVDCDQMCDHCRKQRESKSVDITGYCRDLGTILKQAGAAQLKVTGQKLVDAWQGKGQANLKVAGVKSPSLSREMCEHIVAYLILEGYLKEDFHFTPYSTISYILTGPRMSGVLSGKATVFMEMAGKVLSKPTAAPSTPAPSKLVLSDISIDGQSSSKRGKSMDKPLNKSSSKTIDRSEKESVKRTKEEQNGKRANGEVKSKKAKVDDDESDEAFDLKSLRRKKFQRIEVKSDSTDSECEIVNSGEKSQIINIDDSE